MTTNSSFFISRRGLLRAGSALVLTAVLRPGWSHAAAGYNYRIVAATGDAPLSGQDYPETGVWAYNGEIPGPILRLRQGEPARILVENRLSEGTTVHWHGIRLPNAMDGVPGHQPATDQTRRKLYLRVHPARRRHLLVPPPCQQLAADRPGARRRVDRRGNRSRPPSIATSCGCSRTGVWVPTARSRAGFGNAMEASDAGRVGNAVTLNGTRAPGTSR